MEEVCVMPGQCSYCGDAFEVTYATAFDKEQILLDAIRARQLQLPLVCVACEQ